MQISCVQIFGEEKKKKAVGCSTNAVSESRSKCKERFCVELPLGFLSEAHCVSGEWEGAVRDIGKCVTVGT